MSRPKKAIVEYFPHYTANGKTIYILESEYGNNGYAFWFKVLELLGSTENHFIDCRDKPTWRFILAKSLLDEGMCKKILDTLAEVDAIDSELWRGGIIRSQNFIDNLSAVYQRRGVNVVTKPQLIGLLSTKTPLNGHNVNINPTSIVKESKGKDSIIKQAEKIIKLKSKFQEVTGIPISNNRTFCEFLEILKQKNVKFETIIQNVYLYFNECKTKEWKNFVFAKRWNKIYENMDVFISIENLNDRFGKMVEWNKGSKNASPNPQPPPLPENPADDKEKEIKKYKEMQAQDHPYQIMLTKVTAAGAITDDEIKSALDKPGLQKFKRWQGEFDELEGKYKEVM